MSYYRIYRVPASGELQEVAETPTKEGVGTALVTLGEEGEFEGCTVGVMHKPFDDKPGVWIANPFPPSRDAAKPKRRRSLKGKPIFEKKRRKR